MPTLPAATGAHHPHRSLKDFDGDFEALARLMRESWSQNKSQPLLYTPAYLASCLAYPGTTPHLAPTLYQDSRIVGFVAGFPRRVHYRGRELRLIISAFLTVASEHKRSGYGIVLWSELVKRTRASGYDGLISYSIDGEPMANMMLGCYQRMNVPAARIFSVNYLTRLMPHRQTGVEPEPADPNLALRFMHAASRMAAAVPLARIWSVEEVQWNCRRGDSVVVSHGTDESQGFLTGSLMSIADRDATKCVVLDDVLWNNLGIEERRALVDKLVARAMGLGARMAIVPLQGYADAEAFTKSRFLRSPRLLHAYLGMWNTDLRPEPVNSFYLDVF
ncbi:MAG: hypothetical protein ACREQX_18500 [Candidatus Binataceae bacterium]